MINIIPQMQEFLKYFCTTKIMEHFTLQLSISFPSNDISIVTGIFMFMFRRSLFVIWSFFFVLSVPLRSTACDCHFGILKIVFDYERT